MCASDLMGGREREGLIIVCRSDVLSLSLVVVTSRWNSCSPNVPKFLAEMEGDLGPML